MENDQEIDNDILKWYIVGCHLIQNPKLDDFNKKKLKEFLKTLTLMLNFN